MNSVAVVLSMMTMIMFMDDDKEDDKDDGNVCKEKWLYEFRQLRLYDCMDTTLSTIIQSYTHSIVISTS